MSFYDGQTFDRQGRTFRVHFPFDADHGAPWDESDGHGVVSEWTTREKRPGERVLVEDHGRRRYYDVEATLTIATRDGWGTTPERRPDETARAYRARAVEADFQFLRGWCRDEWHYCGVVVTLVDDPRESESLWGIEDNAGDYLDSVAYELADEIIDRVTTQEQDAAEDARIALAAAYGFGA